MASGPTATESEVASRERDEARRDQLIAYRDFLLRGLQDIPPAVVARVQEDAGSAEAQLVVRFQVAGVCEQLARWYLDHESQDPAGGADALAREALEQAASMYELIATSDAEEFGPSFRLGEVQGLLACLASSTSAAASRSRWQQAESTFETLDKRGDLRFPTSVPRDRASFVVRTRAVEALVQASPIDVTRSAQVRARIETIANESAKLGTPLPTSLGSEQVMPPDEVEPDDLVNGSLRRLRKAFIANGEKTPRSPAAWQSEAPGAPRERHEDAPADVFDRIFEARRPADVATPSPTLDDEAVDSEGGPPAPTPDDEAAVRTDGSAPAPTPRDVDSSPSTSQLSSAAPEARVTVHLGTWSEVDGPGTAPPSTGDVTALAVADDDLLVSFGTGVTHVVLPFRGVARHLDVGGPMQQLVVHDGIVAGVDDAYRGWYGNVSKGLADVQHGVSAVTIVRLPTAAAVLGGWDGKATVRWLALSLPFDESIEVSEHLVEVSANSIRALAATPDGFIAATDDGWISRYVIEGPAVALSGSRLRHGDAPTAVTHVAEHGELLVSAGADHTLSCWWRDGGDPLVIEVPAAVTHLAVGDGLVAVTLDGGAVVAHHVVRGRVAGRVVTEVVRAAPDDGEIAAPLALTADALLVGLQEGAALVWDLRTRKPRQGEWRSRPLSEDGVLSLV